MAIRCASNTAYPPLLMRVGVNTGEVVVRSIRKDDLHTDYVPVGHSTNLGGAHGADGGAGLDSGD